MGEDTIVINSSESHPGENSLQPLQEVHFYKQESNSVCTVILDSSDVTFIPILPVEASEEIVYYEGIQEEVKVEVDCTESYNDNYNEVYIQQESRSVRPKSIISKPRQRVSRHGPHKCRVCSKTFSQFVNLVTHERIHTGEKPFKCSICLKCFSQQPNLWKHMRVHTGERPYQCSTCHKRFTQQANLNKHARIHTGERPYTCQHCGRRFTQQANLTKHVRTHTGERPFHCHFCSKAFVQQSNLERHQRTHTGIKPFKCHMCNDCFAQNAHLSKHLRTIHKITEKSCFVKKMGDKSCFVKLTLPYEEMKLENEIQSKAGMAYIDQYPDSPSKKLGIPVIYCTKTGRILKRVD